MKYALAALSLVAACTSEHQLGSTCEGMCETATLSSGIPCLIHTTDVPRQVTPDPDDFCFTYEGDLDDGMAPCRLYVRFDDGTTCEEAGLPSYSGEAMSGPECELPQLESDARAPTAGEGTGWYLEGPLLPSDTCWSLARYRVRFNGALAVDARLQCTTALAHFSDVSQSERRGQSPVSVSPDRCGSLPPLPLRTPEDTGFACDTRVVPMSDFEVGPMYVDTGAEQCSSGVCLVDSLVACKPPNDCSDGIDFRVATYCSCRCDAKGDTSRTECACPAGFSCFDLLHGEVPDALAGGYCVRVD